MRIVPLSPAPNQSFTVTLDGVRWGLRLTAGGGVTIVDATRDGSTLLTGARGLAGEPLIPYAYLQTGNFIFLVNGGDLPDYRAFGVSQFLIYLSADEIADLNNDPLTVGSLDQFTPSFLTTDDGFYLTTDGGGLLTDD